MLFSFLGLGALVAALVLAWRRESVGAIAVLAALAAYQLAERARLGYYPPRVPWFTIIVASVAVLFLGSSALRRRAPKPAQAPDDPAEP